MAHSCWLVLTLEGAALARVRLEEEEGLGGGTEGAVVVEARQAEHVAEDEDATADREDVRVLLLPRREESMVACRTTAAQLG